MRDLKKFFFYVYFNSANIIEVVASTYTYMYIACIDD